MADSAIRRLVTARIKQLRLEHGLTQEKFAEAVDLSTEAISTIERAKVTPSFETLEAIAKAFDIPLHVFLDFETEAEKLEDKLEAFNKLKQLVKKSDAAELNMVYDVVADISSFWQTHRRKK